MSQAVSWSHDKLLFTPGPLTTSLSVKAAMLHDEGSWHYEFKDRVRAACDKLLSIAGVSKEQGFEVVLMQGSGTFGVEATIGSAIPPNGKALILANGAYGERAIQMATVLKIPVVIYRSSELGAPDPGEVERILGCEPGITHVLMVHCETTSGVLNSIEAIGPVVKKAGKTFIVDAMSSFAAYPIDLAACGIDYLVSSPNKCIEGVPGFSFVIFKMDVLAATEGYARSLSLDLLGQWKGFQKNGQFRYTPPTHAILAFEQALRELEAEGGVAGRGARYTENQRILAEGMATLGFRPILNPSVQSRIITCFYPLAHPNYRFEELYQRLAEKGMIIYPGKLTQVESFRIGSVGRLMPADMRALLAAMRESLLEMGIPV